METDDMVVLWNLWNTHIQTWIHLSKRISNVLWNKNRFPSGLAGVQMCDNELIILIQKKFKIIFMSDAYNAYCIFFC